MKLLLGLFFVLLSLNIVLSSLLEDIQLWHRYKKRHNKIYTKFEEEDRRKRFFATKRFVELHNELREATEDFEIKLNRFADWLPHELDALKGIKLTPRNKREFLSRGVKKDFRGILRSEVEIPDHVNWVKEGAVTPVKDQGICGSCYTFSAAGALEGQHFMKTYQLVELSVQHLIDCSLTYNNSGCDGGLMHRCFQYVADNKGISTYESYPYTGEVGKCGFSRDNIGTSCNGYAVVYPPNDEEALKAAVATVGPISVGIALNRYFMFYSSGIFSKKSCHGEIEHGLLLVGYGTDKETGKKYWLLKNSWGTEWGEKGYVRILRNGKNVCNITEYASYPL